MEITQFYLFFVCSSADHTILVIFCLPICTSHNFFFDAEGLPTLDEAWEYICDTAATESTDSSSTFAQEIAKTEWVHVQSGVPLRRINDLATLDCFLTPVCSTIQFSMESMFTGLIRLLLQSQQSKERFLFVCDLDLFHSPTDPVDFNELLRPLLMQNVYTCAQKKTTFARNISCCVVDGKTSKDFSQLFQNHKFSFVNGSALVHLNVICE